MFTRLIGAAPLCKGVNFTGFHVVFGNHGKRRNYLGDFMKYLTALALAAGLATLAQASDLNQNSLKTLLSAEHLILDGDVHADDTVLDIYNSAVEVKAAIENKCTVIKTSKIAKCTLLITYGKIGEVAIEYTVNAAGFAMISNSVYVSRGI